MANEKDLKLGCGLDSCSERTKGLVAKMAVMMAGVIRMSLNKR